MSTVSDPEEITYPYYLNSIPYGLQHRLQTLDICLPRPLSESPPKDTVWVVFIHGGAWRAQPSAELQPALSQLLDRKASKETLDRVAGFASLNYGLSTYDPASHEGKDKALSVKHPQHIIDVLQALRWLRGVYGVGGQSEESLKRTEKEKEGASKGYDWIAVGHSCGATLSFQMCMGESFGWDFPFSASKSNESSSTSPYTSISAPLTPPLAIVGLEGIYSLPLLVHNHTSDPFYKFFVQSAFGPDTDIWREASPVDGEYETAFAEGGLLAVVLGHSDEDELVEWEQTESMQQCLEVQGWSIKDNEEAKDADGDETGKELVILKLNGTHDAIWEEGTGVTAGIQVAIEKIFTIRSFG